LSMERMARKPAADDRDSTKFGSGRTVILTLKRYSRRRYNIESVSEIYEGSST
jgi:hypothetical protein